MSNPKDWAVEVSEAVNKWLCGQSEVPLSDAIRTALAGYAVVPEQEYGRILHWLYLTAIDLERTGVEGSLLYCRICKTETNIMAGSWTMTDVLHADDCPLAQPSPRGEGKA